MHVRFSLHLDINLSLAALAGKIPLPVAKKEFFGYIEVLKRISTSSGGNKASGRYKEIYSSHRWTCRIV
jgi:hypothetical protein